MRFDVERHTTIDKSFAITTPDDRITLNVDFDDVCHADVDAIAETIARVLNENWRRYSEIYEDELRKRTREEYNKNYHDRYFREEYPSFASYWEELYQWRIDKEQSHA
jgi:hypothetical protein